MARAKKVELTEEEETKVCNKCTLTKPLKDFNTHSKKYPILKSYCKGCQKIYDNTYRKSYEGLITELYKSLKSSSRTRGHKDVEFSKEEFKNWLIINDYDTLYNNWEVGNYYRYSKPSVDRVLDTEGYYFNNMQLVTWFENDKKYKDSVKHPIVVVDVESNIETTFESIRFASRALKIPNCSVSNYIDKGTILLGKYLIKSIEKRYSEL